MGGKNSTQRQGGGPPRQGGAGGGGGRGTTPHRQAPNNMPSHLAGQYDNNNSRQRAAQANNAAAQQNAGQQQQQQQQQNASPPPQQQQQQQQNRNGSPAGNANNSANNGGNERGGVQEGQMVKMLATVEASTVSYVPESQVLTFFVTSQCDAVTYEIHTGVKEFVQGGNVYYMPNKPKLEPTKTEIRGPQENRKITMKLDVHSLEEKEKVFNKHYPKQMPCVVIIRYKTTELRKKEDGRDTNNMSNTYAEEETTVEHTEHTSVDLAERPKRRVISQIVTAGGNAYAVENLYGADNEGATAAGGNGGGAVMIGSTIEEDEDGLCVICLTNPKDTAVMPCRHMCMCKDCGEQLLKHKPVCPVCRAPISTLLHMPSLSNNNNAGAAAATAKA
ncbi:Zinc finger, C3HC4 type (RING finger) containing protein [Novymonas esmeraldas]|uniref:Zinc finger, C3HC4 type (RING finger) containing protein n=1 Tax=Novymonas esmeraldas TaxID=1808958 RepID=A0AAW0ETD9_9TRYP